MSEEPKLPETFEETLKRLAEYNSGPAEASPWLSHGAPATPAEGQAGAVSRAVESSSQTPKTGAASGVQPPPPYRGAGGQAPVHPQHPAVRRSRSTKVVIWAIAGVSVALLSLGVLAPFLAMSSINSAVQQGSPFVDVASSAPRAPAGELWAAYPGTAFFDTATVLAAPTVAEVTKQTEDFSAEIESALTERYGLAWTRESDASLRRANNGYGGDSMLYDYRAPGWEGVADLRARSARQGVLDIVLRVAAAHGLDKVLVANEVYRENPESSKKQFGAATMDKQALWRVYLETTGSVSHTIQIEIFDPTLATDSAFTGYRGVGAATRPSTFTVSLLGWSDSVLDENDRASFLQELAPYDGLTKPKYDD